MPESFFIVSKENLQLAQDEVIAIAKSYDRFAKTQLVSNVVLVQSKIPWDKIAQRATFVKLAGQVSRKMSNLFLDETSSVFLINAKSFACKVINLSKTKCDVTELETVLGDMISKFSKAKVSLEYPEITIYLIITDSQSFFGFSTPLKSLLKPKKVMNYPHELDRKLCRAMINLAGLKEGQTVCDPFCGSGTTLLEAESMGIHSIGIDFDKKMYDISSKNIEANGFKSKIIHNDFKHISKIVNNFDGVVTDLPYGRASKASQVPDKLLQNFFQEVPPKKKLVVMCKKGFEKKIKLKPSKRYDIYRHKSLTRTILVR